MAGLLALLGGGESKAGKPMSPGAKPGGMGDPKRMAAEDLIEAVKSGDADGVASALERHYKLCSMGAPEEEEAAEGEYAGATEEE